jgi:hypothetical protein
VRSPRLGTGFAVVLGLTAVALGSSVTAASAAVSTSTFLGQLHAVTQVASTVPANGDVNPYGVAVIPASVGNLTAGDTLVSNYNSNANVQGTGTTIVEISPTGSTQLFAQIAHSSVAMPVPAASD